MESEKTDMIRAQRQKAKKDITVAVSGGFDLLFIIKIYDILCE